MKYVLNSLILYFAMASAAVAELSVLTYHDIVSDPAEDAYAVSRAMFVAHMDYLQKNGYRVLSLQDVEEIYRTKQAIPKKSVLLTFDDGLISYYKFVVPVLKTYDFPSVASLVTSWIDGLNVPPEYQNKLMTWAQIKEVSKSPLVSLISHSNNLHHGVLSNPQGNEAAASVTRRYFRNENRYESEDLYRQRVNADLQQSIKRFQQELKFKPRAIAWPYGLYDDVISNEATLLGLSLQFTLDPGPNELRNLPRLNRIMLLQSRSIGDFENDLLYRFPAEDKTYVVYLNMDDFYGLSMQEQDGLLGELLDSMQAAQVDEVMLNPFHSEQDHAFFVNGQTASSDDLLNRVTHQMEDRLGIRKITLDLTKYTRKDLDRKKLYTEMARLNRFNGVLMSAEQYADVEPYVQEIKRYRPYLRYGVYNANKNKTNAELVVFTASDTVREKIKYDLADKLNNASVKSYLLVAINAAQTKQAANMVDRMRSLGVKRAGVMAGVKELINYHQQQLAIITTKAMIPARGE